MFLCFHDKSNTMLIVENLENTKKRVKFAHILPFQWKLFLIF